MSIGFYMLGKFRKPQLAPDKFLGELQAWVMRECAELEPACRKGFLEEKATLFCGLHPAAEEIEVCLTDPHHLTVSANTSTVGPGYHIYLCDQLHRWTKQFGITWQDFGPDDDTTFGDEANFFFTGEQTNVYDEMSLWLRGLTGSFFDGTMDADSKEIALCMPMNEHFRTECLATTQLGPRNKEWLYKMSQGEVWEGEFFPWFTAGLNAEYYLGRALVLMWSEVRWRKPVNEDERVLLSRVCGCLRKAYKLQPALPIPWNEWNELLEFLGNEDSNINFVRQRKTGTGTIGYRRSPVKTQLSGQWSIETDGSFSEFKSDEEGTLSSFDPPREIWFTAFSYSADDAVATFDKMKQSLLGKDHDLAYEAKNYISTASITEKESQGNKYYLIRATNVAILKRSICTLVFENPKDREWAIRTWRSIKPPESDE